jgi:hypothetical protein
LKDNGFHYTMAHVTVKSGRQRTCLFVVEASRAALGVLRLTLSLSNVSPLGGGKQESRMRSPDVLLAAEIRGPEWGREYRQDRTAAQSGRVELSTQKATRMITDCERDPRETDSGQITLL